MPIQKLSPVFELKNLIINRHRESRKIFLGQVLTIVDASITDSEQRKAIKDLIRDKFYDNDVSERILKDIILEYVSKYNVDQAPISKIEEDSYMGIIPKGPLDPAGPQWFAKDVPASPVRGGNSN